MKCLAPTVCKAVIPSLPPAIVLTECVACPLDERPPKPCDQVIATATSHLRPVGPSPSGHG